MFENYSECYHCPGVHPMLSKVSPYDSAENDLTEGPFLGGFMKINKGDSLTMSGKACALPVGRHRARIMQRVFYYSIFPNMLLSLHPEYVMVHQLWPQVAGPDIDLVRLVFSSGGVRANGFQAGGRDRVLGHDQQTGLARVRVEPARNRVARVSAGPVFAAGKYSRGMGRVLSAGDEVRWIEQSLARC